MFVKGGCCGSYLLLLGVLFGGLVGKICRGMCFGGFSIAFMWLVISCSSSSGSGFSKISVSFVFSVFHDISLFVKAYFNRKYTSFLLVIVIILYI